MDAKMQMSEVTDVQHRNEIIFRTGIIYSISPGGGIGPGLVLGFPRYPQL